MNLKINYFLLSCLFLLTGVDGQTLTQSEPAPGQSLTITCRVSGYSLTSSSYATNWIRQRDGKQMDWIFTMWYDGSTSKNDALKNKFSMSRDTSARTVTITGQNLQPEDTAVYYCALLYLYRVFFLFFFFFWGGGVICLCLLSYNCLLYA
uniref:Ig-like domain-containing protein n=1 Tax=Haplochromis burtoni TaxID=8153 RepID=A0A3Q2VQI7_HAPBU